MVRKGRSKRGNIDESDAGFRIIKSVWDFRVALFGGVGTVGGSF